MDASETKHTPLPWRAVKNCGYINGSDGIAHYGPREVGVAIVGSYFDKELLPFNRDRWDADVDIIVRAVNSHADMLAALEVAADTIRAFDAGNQSHETGWDHDELRDAWMQVQAAIAKAEGRS